MPGPCSTHRADLSTLRPAVAKPLSPAGFAWNRVTPVRGTSTCGCQPRARISAAFNHTKRSRQSRSTGVVAKMPMRQDATHSSSRPPFDPVTISKPGNAATGQTSALETPEVIARRCPASAQCGAGYSVRTCRLRRLPYGWVTTRPRRPAVTDVASLGGLGTSTEQTEPVIRTTTMLSQALGQ